MTLDAHITIGYSESNEFLIYIDGGLRGKYETAEEMHVHLAMCLAECDKLRSMKQGIDDVIEAIDARIAKEYVAIADAKRWNDVEDYYYAKGVHRGLREARKEIGGRLSAGGRD